MALDIDTPAEYDFPPPVRAQMSSATLAHPMGQGFAMAKAILGARVERRTGSIYTLSREAHGQFDTTHIGNVLVHLRDPALALQKLCAVTTGQCIISETIDSSLEACQGSAASG